MKKFIATYFLLLSVICFVIDVVALTVLPFFLFSAFYYVSTDLICMFLLPLGSSLMLIGSAGIIAERVVNHHNFQILSDETQEEKNAEKMLTPISMPPLLV